MKILTCGMSPYVLLSNGRLNQFLLKHLYCNRHSVASMVWAHDASYYIPEEVNGQSNFYYDFDMNGKHKIPIFPFNRSQNEVVQIYEMLNRLQPDIFITIGDITDHLYMKAIRMFCTKPFKWLAVLTNYQSPIKEEHIDLIQDMDGIVCTSKSSYAEVKNHFDKEIIDWAFVGSPFELQNSSPADVHRIISVGKNAQSDNLYGAMQIVESVSASASENVELYVHANIYDPGEINLESARSMSKSEVISFPDKYVSLFEGISDIEMQQCFSDSDIFLSTSMVSGTAMAAFDAISCGCFPLMAESPCNIDLAESLAEEFYPTFQASDFLIRSTKLLAPGETYLYICDPQDAAGKIVDFIQKHKKLTGIKKEFCEFGRKYKSMLFLDKVMKTVESLKESCSVLWVEK